MMSINNSGVNADEGFKRAPPTIGIDHSDSGVS